MEKKKSPKKAATKDPKKTAEKPAKISKGKTVKKSSAKPAEKLGIRKTEAAKRTVQEEGSIAPPSGHLVDVFAKFRRTGSSQAGLPAVTRLPAGGAPAKAQAPPKKEEEPEKQKIASPPLATPKQVAAAPPASPPPQTPESAAPPTPVATYKLETPAPPRAFAPPSTSPKVKEFPKTDKGSKSTRVEKGAEAEKPFTPPAGTPASSGQGSTPAKVLKPMKVTTLVTVRELAEKMEIKVNDLIKKLMGQGVFVTINQRLDSETAILVASEYGYDLEVVPLHMEQELSASSGVAAVEDKPEDLKLRPPVVTIMGHVDHGKTSLLDAIRETNIVAGESGGITQHIGAYKVKTQKGEIVFLDTPGHEAFTAMRSRGAKVTDIVVLVVSAADGVMPQTVEAIDHAKAANVPIVVAVNKIDLPNANPQKIRQELSQYGLIPEEWGGKTIYVDLSAKRRTNLEKLLEMLLLQAEVLELKANAGRPGVGTVIEAKMDKKRGTVATVLVQNGVAHVGDSFVMGLCYGKVKALITDRGERLSAAGPSTPVEILGISANVPQAGDVFSVVAGESLAKEIAGKRNRIYREEALAHKKHVSLLGLKNRKVKELPVIVKADVQGSIEVLKDSLEKLSTGEILVRVIHAGLGNANESDVLLASASDAIILLFHVDIDARASEVAEKNGVEVRRYDIIYDLTADVKAALEGLLEPEIVDVALGRIEIREVFNVRGMKVAGCYVVDGKVVRGSSAKLIRDSNILGEVRVESLKRFKEDVKEVEKNLECGLVLEGFKDWRKGDQLEVFVKEKRVRRLQPS